MTESIDIDEEEYLYGGLQDNVVANDQTTGKSAQPEETSRMQDQVEAMSDIYSDSDIEVIIETKKGERAEVPKKEALANMKISRTDNTASIKLDDSMQATPKLPGVDLDFVAEFNGTKVTELDLEDFEDKPWRKPGADITDYFNYGFDELTWKSYVSKQSKLRQDYDAQKYMTDMMTHMAAMGANTDLMMQMSMMQSMLDNPNAMSGLSSLPNMQEMMQMNLQSNTNSGQGIVHNQSHYNKGVQNSRDLHVSYRENERQERENRIERSDRPERIEHGDRTERSDRLDRGDKYDRSDRMDRGDKVDRSDRNERMEKTDRADRDEREKTDRADRRRERPYDNYRHRARY